MEDALRRKLQREGESVVFVVDKPCGRSLDEVEENGNNVLSPLLNSRCNAEPMVRVFVPLHAEKPECDLKQSKASQGQLAGFPKAFLCTSWLDMHRCDSNVLLQVLQAVTREQLCCERKSIGRLFKVPGCTVMRFRPVICQRYQEAFPFSCRLGESPRPLDRTIEKSRSFWCALFIGAMRSTTMYGYGYAEITEHMYTCTRIYLTFDSNFCPFVYNYMDCVTPNTINQIPMTCPEFSTGWRILARGYTITMHPIVIRITVPLGMNNPSSAKFWKLDMNHRKIERRSWSFTKECKRNIPQKLEFSVG